ncbi:MAG TPA: hypothetical protein QF626_06755, partial [Prochlorococcaceae cyanobacterium Fu_MAG_50]|nr:hypothetical protein [Prochlorococcaceae cyanobacterium Fu_MAG_50]
MAFVFVTVFVATFTDFLLFGLAVASGLVVATGLAVVTGLVVATATWTTSLIVVGAAVVLAKVAADSFTLGVIP